MKNAISKVLPSHMCDQAVGGILSQVTEGGDLNEIQVQMSKLSEWWNQGKQKFTPTEMQKEHCENSTNELFQNSGD